MGALRRGPRAYVRRHLTLRGTSSKSGLFEGLLRGMCQARCRRWPLRCSIMASEPTPERCAVARTREAGAAALHNHLWRASLRLAGRLPMGRRCRRSGAATRRVSAAVAGSAPVTSMRRPSPGQPRWTPGWRAGRANRQTMAAHSARYSTAPRTPKRDLGMTARVKARTSGAGYSEQALHGPLASLRAPHRASMARVVACVSSARGCTSGRCAGLLGPAKASAA